MAAFSIAENVVNLSNGGRLHPSGDLHTPANQLEQIFAGFRASNANSMTIFFHGGLVSEQNAIGFAQGFYREIAERCESYPVFVIWETGPLESLESALVDIYSSSPLFLKVLQKLMKHVSRKLRGEEEILEGIAVPEGMTEREEIEDALEKEVLPGVDPARLQLLDPVDGSQIPAATSQEIAALQADLADDEVAGEVLEAILVEAEARQSQEGLESVQETDRHVGFLSQDLLSELVDRAGAADSDEEGVADEESDEETDDEAVPGLELALPGPAGLWFFVGRVFAATINRFRQQNDHGFIGTILEEMYRHIYADRIGRFLWDEMKENAREAYTPNPAGAPSDDFHGGTHFLTLLKEQIDQHGPLDLHLVGHSAGCIQICHFVERAAAILGADFSIKTVVFAAPACNLATLNQALVPHASRIRTFRIFTMSDELERKDPLVRWLPILYPHSLLYLVSGLFEESPDIPLAGLDRHLRGERYNANTVVGATRTFLTDVGPLAVAYSQTAADAPAGSHAQFTSHYGAPGPMHERATLDSIGHLIRGDG